MFVSDHEAELQLVQSQKDEMAIQIEHLKTEIQSEKNNVY